MDDPVSRQNCCRANSSLILDHRLAKNCLPILTIVTVSAKGVEQAIATSKADMEKDTIRFMIESPFIK